MADDSYELVPRGLVQKLKEENKKLNQELEDLKKKIISSNNIDNKPVTIDKEVLYQIEQISKKERETIISYLEQIKELNEKNLDKTLTRTEILDKKLEDLIGTVKELVINLEEIINNYSKNNETSESEYVKNIIKELNNNSITNENKIDQIEIKLMQIEDFMNKLKILLSQIKPSDLSYR